MEISCLSCGTSHEIPDAMLVGRGRKVRCRNCRQIWLVEAIAPAAEEIMTGPSNSAQGQDEPQENAPLGVEPDAPAAPAAAPERRRYRGRAGRAAAASTGVPRQSRPGAARSRVALLALALAGAAAVALVVFRAEVVGLLPQTARLYAAIGLPVNLRGFDLARLRSRIVDEKGVSVLVIEGEVTNVTRAPLAPPPLRYAVRGSDGVELYVWTARLDKPMLDGGESVAFRRRLASPPSDGREVLVTFSRVDETASATPRATP